MFDATFQTVQTFASSKNTTVKNMFSYVQLFFCVLVSQHNYGHGQEQKAQLCLDLTVQPEIMFSNISSVHKHMFDGIECRQ